MDEFHALAIEEQEDCERASVATAAFRATAVVTICLSFGKEAASSVDLLHSSGLRLFCLDFLGRLHQRGAPGRAPGPYLRLRGLL